MQPVDAASALKRAWASCRKSSSRASRLRISRTVLSLKDCTSSAGRCSLKRSDTCAVPLPCTSAASPPSGMEKGVTRDMTHSVAMRLDCVPTKPSRPPVYETMLCSCSKESTMLARFHALLVPAPKAMSMKGRICMSSG